MSTENKTIKPLQRLSYAEKVASNGKWGEENAEYLIATSRFGRVANPQDRDIQLLYDLYNNKFPDTWFNYITNPLNSKKNEYKNFPSRIRPYTILRPNIDLFCGEYGHRPFNYRVNNLAIDSYNSFIESKKAALKDNITQHFINEANSKGADTGQESKQVDLPEDLVNKFLSSYKDIKAMMGQDALTIIEEEESLREKFSDLIKDWVIAGEVYSYKDVRFSEIEYERVSPLDIDYDKSIGAKYIEDSDWVTRRMYLTVSDVVDRWYEELEEKDHQQIENDTGATQSGFRIPSSFLTRFSSLNREETRRKVEIIHCTWKSKVKFGVLTYPDPLTGEEQQMEVSEDYPVDKEKGESVKWMWGNQWWESYRVDGNIYLGTGPIPVQRNEMNNFSKCKGPYNGKRFSDLHSENVSPMEMGIPYQVMHIIYKYRLELTLNKHKGQIALIDKNVIPNKPGWDEEKFLYYAEALGYMFIDRNQIGVDKGFNQYQVLNMDLFTHIEQMLKLIDANKREWDEVLGINPYRKGQTQASDAVGNVQQGIFQSSIISEVIYKSFEDFIKTEMKGLLDYSKFAWVDGKKKLYRTPDLKTSLVDINPEDYVDTDFDIFVTDSSEEAEQLKIMKSIGQSMAQNGGKASTVAEIIASKNIAQLTNKLKEIEALEQKLAEASEQNKYKADQDKLSITKDIEAMKNNFAGILQDSKYDREEELARIKGDYQILSASVVKEGEDKGIEGIVDLNSLEDRNLEREKVYHDTNIEHRKLSIKEKELADKNKQTDKKVEVEKYKADKTVEVAKLNKQASNNKKPKK